jgi:hypothetical protein
MEVYGEGGVLVSLMGLMGWVYGRTLRRVEGSSIVTPDFIIFFYKSEYYIKKKKKKKAQSASKHTRTRTQSASSIQRKPKPTTQGTHKRASNYTKSVQRNPKRKPKTSQKQQGPK